MSCRQGLGVYNIATDKKGGHQNVPCRQGLGVYNIATGKKGGHLEMSCLRLPIFNFQYELLYGVEQSFLLVAISMDLMGIENKGWVDRIY